MDKEVARHTYHLPRCTLTITKHKRGMYQLTGTVQSQYRCTFTLVSLLYKLEELITNLKNNYEGIIKVLDNIPACLDWENTSIKKHNYTILLLGNFRKETPEFCKFLEYMDKLLVDYTPDTGVLNKKIKKTKKI